MSVTTSIKRVLIGRPFPTHAEAHERLDKKRGLAIFASDPISSNAYATEAIMTVLIILGTAGLAYTMPIALAIAALIALVIFSYTQTILHYPHGGGAYIVAKDNLGTLPALTAGAALLIDYVLTVSVSVSAGVRALTSAFPALHDWRVLLALFFVALLTVINLRGVRESGTIFAFPTYAFVVGVLLTVLIGLARYFGVLGAAPLPPHELIVQPATTLGQFGMLWLLLRAFAAGCTALTGIEAISDGVAAFKKPEAKNAAETMIAMGAIAMTLFVGISFLAWHMNLVPEETDSILSQMTRSVASGLPGGGLLYYWVQIFTMAILVLAANTGFQDFPRLGFFLARDGFMPRWMQNKGDRLVFSYGILLLAIISSLLIVLFRADEIAMLPLYAIGVMVSFTISQAGMVRLWGKIATLKPGETMETEATTLRAETGLGWKRLLNGTGAVVTGIVLVVIIATKFSHGAWLVVIAMPMLILLFRGIKSHYLSVRESLRTRDVRVADVADVGNIVLVPIADIHRGTLRALKYARKLAGSGADVRIVSIVTDPALKPEIIARFERFPELTEGMTLELVDYEYRDVLDRLVDYISYVKSAESPDQLLTVVVPEFVPRSVAENLLHNQTANLLRLRLRAQPDVVVIDVPYHL